MPDSEPEIYNAVQGEGKTIGKPVVFCRLSGCNLMCSWCDTSYTWNFDHIKRKNPHATARPVNINEYQKKMTSIEVADYIESIGKEHKGVVFTGGEPLLQQKEIIEVIDILRSRDESWYFEIETNGTLKMDEELGKRLNQINSSPKLKSSGNNPLIAGRPESIAALMSHTAKYGKSLCFKFVVKADNWEKDIEEIKQWQAMNKIPNNLIWLMPEGTEKEVIQKGTMFLNDIAVKLDYNVSTRLQVLIYGPKRAT